MPPTNNSAAILWCSINRNVRSVFSLAINQIVTENILIVSPDTEVQMHTAQCVWRRDGRSIRTILFDSVESSTVVACLLSRKVSISKNSTRQVAVAHVTFPNMSIENFDWSRQWLFSVFNATPSSPPSLHSAHRRNLKNCVFHTCRL